MNDRQEHVDEIKPTNATSSSSFGRGAEPHLVGIAPQFWAHVPLLVADVQSLQLVNDMNCLPRGNNDDDWIPVSNCTLVGCIVNAVMRSDGSTAYVLDDGTGMMDCVAWSNDPSNNSSEGLFALPCLIQDKPEQQVEPPIGIGDLVRVFGKIHCLWKDEHGKVSREIQTNLIERVESSNSIEMGCSLDAEAQHWMQYLKQEESRTQNPTEHNSLGYVKLLGPHMESQIAQRRNLPKVDDTSGMWRVFGMSCQCQLKYMDRLLYCHCKARLEPLDPHFVFRDAVLETLLEMQDACEKKLVFHYKLIKDHAQLRHVASQLTPPTGKTEIFINRLFINTFRALRTDGILFLEDPDQDQYLLITRDKVLEPFVRDTIDRDDDASDDNNHATLLDSKNFINFRGAPFLAQVDHERLLYIRRSIQE